VPSGVELVFNVPESVKAERQQVVFDIADPDGNAVCHVSVDETREGTRRGIFLQLLDGSPLAHVRTDSNYKQFPSSTLSHICKTNGEVFCRLERVEDDNDGKDVAYFYVLRTTSGEVLYEFKGTFGEKCINAISKDGTLACATRRCKLGIAGGEEAFYEVRVAAGVDAGLMLCGLLALDKVGHTQGVSTA